MFGSALFLVFDLDEAETSVRLGSTTMEAKAHVGIANVGETTETVSVPAHVSRDFNCQIEDFSENFDDEEYAEQLWQLRERSDRAVASLSDSETADHVFVAASMPYSSGSNRYDLDLLSLAIEQEPGNSRFQWHRLNACINGSEHPVCTDRQVEFDAINSDSGNGAIWTLVAKNRVIHGDIDGALKAITMIATSPRFEGFFIDDAKSFERSLAAISDLSYVERMTWGISAAVALLSSSPHLNEICKPYLETSEEWRAQCLLAAERTIDGNSSLLHTQIALELQRNIYEYSGEVEDWNEKVRRLEHNRAQMELASSPDVQLVLGTDDRVLAAYVDEFEIHGEIAAMRFSYAETERLKKNPAYNPCELIPTPVP